MIIALVSCDSDSVALVPNVMGLHYADAVTILEDAGFDVSAVGADVGTILSQSKNDRTILKNQVFRVNNETDPNYRDSDYRPMAPDKRVVLTYANADYLYEESEPDDPVILSSDPPTTVAPPVVSTPKIPTNEAINELWFFVSPDWRKRVDDNGNTIFFYPTEYTTDGYFFISTYTFDSAIEDKQEAATSYIIGMTSDESFIEEIYLEFDLEIANHYTVRHDGVFDFGIIVTVKSYTIFTDICLYSFSVILSDYSPDYLEDAFYLTLDSISFDGPVSSGSSISWKQFLIEYEQWVDRYIELLKKYNENPTDLTLLTEYIEQMEEIADWADKADKLEDDLTGEDLNEYLTTLTRIITKLNHAIASF